MPANIQRAAIRLATIGLPAVGVEAFVLVFGVDEPGVEPVAAYLVFHVVDAPAGAILQVRDVMVQ